MNFYHAMPIRAHNKKIKTYVLTGADPAAGLM